MQEKKYWLNIGRLLLYFFLFLKLNTAQEIQTQLVEDKLLNKYVYITKSLSISAQRKEVVLFLDSEDDRLVFSNYDVFYDSYTADLKKKTEIIEVGHKIFRIEFGVDSKVNEKCSFCDGLIGINSTSFLWSIWPEYTIRPGSILLNREQNYHPNTFLQNTLLACTGSAFLNNSCQYVSSSESEDCFIEALLKYDNNSEVRYLKFNTDSFTYLPRQIFDKFMKNRSIFKPETFDNATLSLEFINNQNRTIIIDIKEKLTLNIEKLRLIVLPHDKDYIMLGILHWDNGVISRNMLGNNFVFRIALTSNHYSALNITFFFIIMIAIVRTKEFPSMPSVSVLRKSEIALALDTIGWLISIGIIIATLFIPSSINGVREDFPGLYWTYFSVTIILVLVDLIMNFYPTFFYAVVKQKDSSKWPVTIKIQFLLVFKSVHLTSLFISLTLVLLQRRRDQPATQLVILSTAYVIYELTYVLLILFYLGYYVLKLYNGKRFFIYCYLIFPSVYTVNIGASYYFLILPSIQSLLNGEAANLGILFTITSILYLIILTLSAYVFFLFTRLIYERELEKDMEKMIKFYKETKLIKS